MKVTTTITFWDMFRYIVSGVSSVVVQFGTLIALVQYGQVNETLSSGIAFVIGCIVNYLLLYYWAFASKSRHHIIIMRFAIVNLLTLSLNLAIFWVLTERLNLWYLFSQIIATISAAIANLFLNRFYAFT